jgi:hypothetical protein
MQICIDKAAVPLLGPASLPLPERVPTWTTRIARPISTHRDELARELRGVPKAALRHVFGKLLGTRLWHTNTAKAAKRSIDAPASDSEISRGMLRYLCAEASATLRERQRLAKSISLTLQYPNGDSETAHQLLLQSTNDPESLEAAAQAAIRGMRSSAFVSLKLDLTASPA